MDLILPICDFHQESHQHGAEFLKNLKNESTAAHTAGTEEI
jgi:hypothetical protein